MGKKSEEKILIVNDELKASEEAVTARTVLMPTLQGAVTVQKYSKWFPADLDLKELIGALAEQTTVVIHGDLGRAEAMLTVQAHTLDAIFNSLARKAMSTELLNQFEAYLKLSLRAQSQCRTTWEVVSAIKHPPVASYISQANIAHGPQQVNNASRAGENGKPPNKLLEDNEHEPDQWVDRGTQNAASEADTRMETVAEVHGAEDARRKSEGV